MQREKPQLLSTERIPHKGVDKMDYADFMITCSNFLKSKADYKICGYCGGTGISAVMCCSGRECGCRAEPVDFELKCPKCGTQSDLFNPIDEFGQAMEEGE
jgi:hypothetical protein